MMTDLILDLIIVIGVYIIGLIVGYRIRGEDDD